MTVYAQDTYPETLHIPECAPLPEGHRDDPDMETLCWSFMGVNGGSGVTSLCIQLAYTLVNQSKIEQTKPSLDNQVCIVDLDFENGSVARYLNVEPQARLNDIQEAKSRIDTDLVKSFISHTKSGIDVFAIENTLAGNDAADPMSILEILDGICQIYPYVILDLPQIWRPWTEASIATSNQFLLVMELTVPNLHRAKRRISEIEDQVDMMAPCALVLNRYERRAFRNTLRKTDVEALIPSDIIGEICIDGETVKDAINRGTPVGVSKPDCRYAKDILALARTLQDQSIVEPVCRLAS